MSKTHKNVDPYIGKKYGNLTVLDFAGRDEYRHLSVRCLCECGRETITVLKQLKTGQTKRCGKCRGDTFREVFYSYTKLSKETGCLEWQGGLSKCGYGIVKKSGKSYRANRMAWILERGEIPPGMQVLHRCDNPCCVNIDHLFLGTQLDNMRDCIEKGRYKNVASKTPTG